MVGTADDGDIAMRDATVLDRLDRGRRNVDHDVTVAERKRHSGQAIRAGGELIVPDGGRNVQGRERRAGHDACLSQAHTLLEVLHRGGEFGAPGHSMGVLRVDIALHRQPLAKPRHGRPFRSRPEARDVGRPAARIDDRAIALGRLRGGVEGRRSDGWIGIDREGRLARRRGGRGLLRLGLGLRFRGGRGPGGGRLTRRGGGRRGCRRPRRSGSGRRGGWPSGRRGGWRRGDGSRACSRGSRLRRRRQRRGRNRRNERRSRGRRGRGSGRRRTGRGASEGVWAEAPAAMRGASKSAPSMSVQIVILNRARARL